MAGKNKRMKHQKRKLPNTRQKIWQSMRILRRFTVPDLCRTAQAKYDNAQRWCRHLWIHGYLRKSGPRGKRPGEHQAYTLMKDMPIYPLVCDRCGNKISAKKCEPEAATPGPQQTTQPLAAANRKNGGIK